MKKSLILIISNIIFSLSQWVILFFLIKTQGPTLVGIFGLTIALVSPIIILSNFQIRSLQATDLEGRFTFAIYHGVRMLTYICGVIITGIVIFMYSNDYLLLMTLIGLMKFTDSLSEVAYGRFQQDYKPERIGYSKILKGILTLTIVFITWHFNLSLNFLFCVATLTYLLIYIFFDIIYVKNKGEVSITPQYKIEDFKTIFIIALPLMLGTFLGSLNTNIPRYFVEHYLGLELLGYFVSFAYLINIGNIFVSSIAQIYLTPLTKLFLNKEFKVFLKKIFKFIIGVAVTGTVLMFLLILFSNQMIPLLFDDSYLRYKQEFIVIMISGLISYLGAFIGYGNIASKNFKALPILGVIWVVISVISAYILIPKYGLLGAALTLLISNFSILISRISLLFYNIKINLRDNNVKDT